MFLLEKNKTTTTTFQSILKVNICNEFGLNYEFSVLNNSNNNNNNNNKKQTNKQTKNKQQNQAKTNKKS